MTYYPPSVDPANLDTLTGAFREILGKATQYTDGMLPAQVVNINAGPPMTVGVQPLVMLVATDGSSHSRAPIYNVPVMQFGGGGCLLTFPVKVGDVGFILANDRDISTFIQQLSGAGASQSPPNTFRMKTFSDAIFMPAVLSGYTLADLPGAAMTLQTIDGTVSITISERGVVITSPILTINSTTALNITTPLISLTGNMVATGTVTAANIP